MGFLYGFMAVMGDADFDDIMQTINPALAIFLLSMLIFFATIVLLNLLIALMNNAYGTVREKVS